MRQICTTREQSKKLQELGISVDTADMSWHFTNMKSEALQWELKTTSLTTKENFFGKIEKLASPFYKHADGSPMTGEEIFDGDIMEFTGSMRNFAAEVVYNEEETSFCLRLIDSNAVGIRSLGSWLSLGYECAIIDNVHDNPEMVKGDEK